MKKHKSDLPLSVSGECGERQEPHTHWATSRNMRMEPKCLSVGSADVLEHGWQVVAQEQVRLHDSTGEDGHIEG